MNPPRFHPGQAVVCLAGFPDGDPTIPHPYRGQLCHVTGFRYSARFAQWGLHLAEFAPHFSYGEKSFAPVEELPEGALAELLGEVWAVEVG